MTGARFCKVEGDMLIYPFDPGILRADGVSLGPNPSPDTLAKHGVHYVYQHPEPPTEQGFIQERADRPRLINGFYVLDWLKRPQTAGELALVRTGMTVSTLQLRLALGETGCTKLDALATDPKQPWAMRQKLARADRWKRTSEQTEVLQAALAKTDTEMDALFQQAMEVDA